MTVRILLILGILIGLYAIFNNIRGLNPSGIDDPVLAFGKFLIALFPVIAGVVIIYVSLSGLFSKKEKKNETTDKKS
ncbi:MAG: hypothetical protein ABWJ98_05190 [Hydrogenothermaceae bacterium]